MGVDRWKNGEVVAKKGQFFIQFEEMKVCSFWHANFKKGWKGVNLGILKMAGGYLGLNTMIWEFRVKIWVRYESKCCDLVGGTSNGVVKKIKLMSRWVKKLWVAQMGCTLKEEIESFKLSYYGGW